MISETALCGLLRYNMYTIDYCNFLSGEGKFISMLCFDITQKIEKRQ